MSTQTAETAFALCVRCASSQTALASAAETLKELCFCLQLPSLMAETDWNSEAETGILEPKKWGTSMTADLARIKTYSLAQQRELETLKDEVAQQKSLYEYLQSKTAQLSVQCEILERTVAESKRDHMKELAICHESASARLSEMKAAQEMIQECSNRLEEELSSVQQEKAKLRASLDDMGESEVAVKTYLILFPCAERKNFSLHAELSEVQDHNTALSQSQTAVQDQLDQLHTELNQCREELEANRLQLNKMSLLNHTIERKNKVSVNH